MKQFYITDLTRLKDFGFIKHENGRYVWLYKHRTPAMWVYDDDQRLTIQSPSKDAVATICEMYRQGVVGIYEDDELGTFNMKVTEDEMNLIHKMRKEKLTNASN